MKKIVLLFVLTSVLISCTINKKPKFVKVNSVEIIDTSIKNFTLLANLQFKNENSVGGTLQAKNVHVFMDSLDVITINTAPFKVPKKSEFELPIKVKIPFSKVYKDGKQNLLNSIMNVIMSKKVTINYKGEIQYKSGSFTYDYPLNYKQKIELKK